MNNVNIIWNDVPTNIANGVYSSSLTVSTTSCSNSTINFTTLPLNIITRSLSQSTAGPISLNGQLFTGQLPFGDNTRITLSVPQVRLPYPNNQVEYAGAYEWTIPAGWVFNSGSATSNNSVITLTNTVDVTPSADGAGSIRVRAIDNNCTRVLGGNLNNVSKTPFLTLSITRPTPTLTIASNRTPQGGPITLFCGEEFRHGQVYSVAGSLPAGGGFSNYQFAVTGVLRSYCCLKEAVPGVYILGTGTGTINLTATYTARNGASTTVTAPEVTVTVRPELATPVFAAATTGDLCPGSTKRFEVRPVPGADTYTWEVTPATAGFGPFAATAVPYLDVTAPGIVGASLSLTMRVRAAATASCAASVATALPFQFGAGTSRLVTDQDGPNAGVTPEEICGSSYVNVLIGTDNERGTLSDIIWSTTAGTTILPGAGTGNGYPYLLVRAPAGGPHVGLGVYCSYTDGCGIPRSLGRVFTVVNQRSDGSVCAEGWIPRPTAYPNPADKDVSVQHGGGAMRLYNAYGQPVRTQTVKPGPLQLDTSQLPAGLYYLETRDAKGKTVRQQIRIQH